MSRLYALPLLLLLPAAAAQTVAYSPAPFAQHAGLTSTGYPLGYRTITKMTYQQVHGDLPRRPMPIRSLAWRPYRTCTSFSAYQANLTLTMGQGGPLPDQAVSTFATNLGPNPTVVLKNTTVKIPAYTKVPPPAPYLFVLPFQKVYLYKGKGALCWEARVHSHTYTGTTLSFALYSHRATAALQPGGTGCKAFQSANPASLSGTFSPPNLSLKAAALPSTGVAFLLAGNKSTRFGSLTLPFDLTPLGAPCALRTSLEFLFTSKISNGSASWNFTVPAAAPDGTALFFQVLAPDSRANPAGLVLTDGLAAIWPYSKRPVVRIWRTNDDQAKSGSLQLTFGLVVRFSF